ncbi:HNH endonuclease signature motif containing protein [Actinopolymorpha alba]|uniref:HNH endonuclease signature motif containing protein n=1 Tax=Actinopolymorpha alba TaxID=533267 RepID=UPI000363E41D|nr:HNH endonuclease signature motif containing protein [Actinopolymorpha alba]
MDSTSTDAGRHPFSVLADRARARFAEESGAPLWSTPGDELTDLLISLEALSAQIEAVQLQVIREADRQDLGRTAGATSTAALLSSLLRMRPEHARAAVRLANDLDTALPLVQLALNAGEISADHARVIAKAIRDLPKEAGQETRAEAEQVLVEHARVFDPKDLAGLGRAVLNAVDPDLADKVLAKKLAEEEAKAARQSELSLYDDPDGSGTHIRGKLDPIAADRFRTAIEPLSKPLPTTADGLDPRSPAQRRGDAFDELVRRYLDSGASPSQGGEKPHIVVTITDEDLVNGTGLGRLLRTGTYVSARTVQEWACDAKVSWFGIRDGEVALSDGTRFFTGRLRKLLELRDRGCAFPGCDRPPAWCHGHHVQSWLNGGPTTVANGALLCGYHHRLIHQGTWKVQLAADGVPEFTPPEWIDPNRNPIRNNRLRT